MFSLKDLQDMYAKIDYGIHHHRKNQKAYQQHTNHERNLKNGKHAAAIRKGKFPRVYYLRMPSHTYMWLIIFNI